MLKIEHVSKKFDELIALQDVTFNIRQGEFFGLLGPNGAGKSTLMNIIVGYLLPDSGIISIEGSVMKPDNPDWRRKIGYVPQEISLFLDLSAHQNLKIFGRLYGLTSRNLEEKIEGVLDLVQLSDRKKDPVKDFSGGMKRRLNLAASLLHDPDVILCDEPTVGVDPQSRNAIFDMLLKLNKSGKTIVYTTHYMEEAERMCPRLAVIDHGIIIAQGTLTELIDLINQKDTLKIRKTPFVQSKIAGLSDLGNIAELDFYYEILPSDDYRLISRLFSRLESTGIPNELIQISRPTLEDVFLKLTGRSLRD